MSRRRQRPDARSPRVVHSNDRVVVIDNVLPPASFDKLWNYFQVQDFRRIESLGLFGHWALGDAAALRGPAVGYGMKLDREYPSGTPMDLVIDAVAQLAEKFENVLGAYGDAWRLFSAFAQAYPRGTGLLWHRDSEDNAGSYTYYAHPAWNVSWGGELLLLDDLEIDRKSGVYFHRLRDDGTGKAPAWQPHLDNEDASQALMEHGVGQVVLPKPNRLVVIRGGTPHRISKVTEAAGAAVRASVSGFFKREAVADSYTKDN